MILPPENSSLYRSTEGYQQVMAHYDATLQGMGIPYEEMYAATRFGNTHAVICGNQNGKPVVLWHGQNANASTWANWIPALSSAYCIYAVDTIGSMGKSAPSRPSKKGPFYGEWAAETLEGFGLKRANMIGASEGGWLILKLGGVSPELIASAVLMSSAGFSPLSKGLVFRMLPRVLFKSPAEAARGTLALLSPPELPLDSLFLDILELMMTSGFRSERLSPVVRDQEIKRLNAPTCLLMGQYEASFNPYKALERGLRLLPNVITAEIVPDVGHAMLHRQPDWVTSRLTRFLDIYAR